MKTDRRHELQTNELADWLGEHFRQFQPYMKAVMGAAVLLVAAVFAFSIMQGQREGRRILSWNEYFFNVEMSDPEGLRDVATQFRGTEAAAWSWKSAGDLAAATATRELILSRDRALEQLNSAVNAYTQAISTSKDSLLLQRAYIARAQAFEALNQFEDAQQDYETIINRWPGTALAQEADDRLRILQQPSTRKFYDWFIQQKPAAATPDEPGVGVTPPSFGDDLLNDPDLSLPSADALQSTPGAEITPPQASMDTEFAPSPPAESPDPQSEPQQPFLTNETSPPDTSGDTTNPTSDPSGPSEADEAAAAPPK